jgi:hypothetical protein
MYETRTEKLVLSTEHEGEPILGILMPARDVDEDIVRYYTGLDEEEKIAPADCVRIVTVYIPSRTGPLCCLMDQGPYGDEGREGFLPGSLTLDITYKTWDADPGDPEHGPAPDVETRPFKWTLRLRETGEVLLGAVIGEDHDWVPATWTDNPPPDPSISDALHELVKREAFDEGTRGQISNYLYHNGLL